MCLFIFTPRSKNKRICCSISLEDVHVGCAYITLYHWKMFMLALLTLLYITGRCSCWPCLHYSISLEDIHVGRAYITLYHWKMFMLAMLTLLYITGRCSCWPCLHYYQFIICFKVMMLLLLFRAIWNFEVRHKEFFTFSVKDIYQLNYFICIKDFNAQRINSLKLNCFISLFTAVSIMNGNRPVLIYFCYQTDSEIRNVIIYSAFFLASPYYNYL
jgi:hypothetical protein